MRKLNQGNFTVSSAQQWPAIYVPKIGKIFDNIGLPRGEAQQTRLGYSIIGRFGVPRFLDSSIESAI
jgi:hypothetical protein